MTESGQKCFGCYGLKSSSFFSKKEWMKSDNDETRRCKQCRRDSHLKNKKKRDSEASLTISSPQTKSQKKDKEARCKACKEVLNHHDDVYCIHCRYVIECRRDSAMKNKKKRDSEAGLTISSPQAVKSQKKDKETKCKICKEVLNRRDDVFCIHCRYVADAVKNKIVLKNLINAIV